MHSTVHQTEVLLFFTLLQLSVIVVAARIAGEIAVRLSQARDDRRGDSRPVDPIPDGPAS